MNSLLADFKKILNTTFSAMEVAVSLVDKISGQGMTKEIVWEFGMYELLFRSQVAQGLVSPKVSNDCLGEGLRR